MAGLRLPEKKEKEEENIVAEEGFRGLKTCAYFFVFCLEMR